MENAILIEESPHIQIKLFSNLKEFKEADVTLSIPQESNCVALLALLKAHLSGRDLLDGTENLEFDFLIQGTLLRTSLAEYIELTQTSTESVIEIEFIYKYPSPKPEQSLLHNDWVSSVHASQDFILSGCYDNTVKIHTFDGKDRLTLPAHCGPVRCVRWISSENPDSMMFVTGSHDQLLYVWTWDSVCNDTSCLFKCSGHTQSVESIAVSPDSLQFVSGSRDAQIKLWTLDQRGTNESTENAKRRKTDTLHKTPLLSLNGHHEGVVSVCWAQPETLVSAGLDHTIRIWDLVSQSDKQIIKSSKSFISMDVSPLNELFISGSSDRHIRMWDSRARDATMVTANFSSHTGWVSSVMWSRHDENLFVSASYDQITKLWDRRSPKAPMYDMTGHGDKVLSVDWTKPQYILSGGADNHLNIFSYKK